jgi:prophage DNA circulation protein
MEKLNLLENAKDWITLRQTRNTVSHEYPFYKEIQIEELNLLPEEVEKLADIWIRLKEYALSRLTAESDE